MKFGAPGQLEALAGVRHAACPCCLLVRRAHAACLYGVPCYLLVLRHVLLLYRRMQVGAPGQLEALAGARHAACVDAVAPVLSNRGRWRALALLWAAHARYQVRAAVWMGILQDACEAGCSCDHGTLDLRM